MSKLKLEVGKAYRMRNGEKAEIIDYISSASHLYNEGYVFKCVNDGGYCFACTKEGRFYNNKLLNNRLDLISEWEEEPKTHFEQSVPGISEVRTGDTINHPAHYTGGKVECIDAIESATTGLTGIEAVCTANAIKYLWRWKQKNGVEDLKKAQWYINNLIEKL